MKNKTKFFFWKLKVIFIKNIFINSYAFENVVDNFACFEGKVAGFSSSEGFKIAIKWNNSNVELLTIEEIKERKIIIIS